MARSRIHVLGALGALSAACGGAGMTDYTPVHEQTKLAPDVLLSASRDAADELGYTATGVDTEGHSMDTREKEVAVSSIPRLSYKYAFHIETKGGLLSIVASCTKNSAVSEDKYQECGDDRPERVVNAQAKLKERILTLAPKMASKEPDWNSFEHPPADEDEKADKDAKADKKSDGKSANAKPASPEGDAKKPEGDAKKKAEK